MVNRRKTKLIFLLFTVISTNVGAGTFVAFAAAGYSSGISYGLTIGIATFISFLIVAFFAPYIKKFGNSHNAYTIGDWFGFRYSPNNRVLIAVLVLFSYFFWMALQFIALGSLLRVASGLPWNISLIVSGIVVIIYTTFAGIKSDFYTDFIQFWLIFITFIILLPIGLSKIGGIQALSSLPNTYFNIFSFGGVPFFVGTLLLGVPLLLVSMEIWQRIYAASDEKTAQKCFLFAALINGPILLLSSLLGMIAAVLFSNLDQELALFKLMFTSLPSGLLGIGIAGIIAAFMSTVDSMIMVESATFLKDIYKSFINKKASEWHYLKVARISTLIFGAVGLIVAYLIPNIIQVQLFATFTLLCFVPSVIGGIIWQRGTSKASFLSVLCGFIVMTLLFFLSPIQRQSFIPGVLFALIIYIVVSLLNKQIKKQ